jgi:hypothetical protein
VTNSVIVTSGGGGTVTTGEVGAERHPRLRRPRRLTAGLNRRVS